jgi:chemotaxis protein CheD
MIANIARIELAPERLVYLYPGDLAVSQEPCALNTVVGSCVAVFLWDARRKLGGMNHYLLPRQPATGELSPRFGNSAIQLLIERMRTRGSEPCDLVAKVFGGAHVLGHATPDKNHLGLQNADVAMEALREARIQVLASDLGGNRGRRVVAHTADGSAWVKEL